MRIVWADMRIVARYRLLVERSPPGLPRSLFLATSGNLTITTKFMRRRAPDREERERADDFPKVGLHTTMERLNYGYKPNHDQRCHR